MTAKYWIAQYIEDLFRKESRNVGVIVQLDGQVEGKFLGEQEGGEMDGRKLKSFKNPEVYKQWVQYWRKTAETGAFYELLATSGKHYSIFEGGEVTSTEGDSPRQVVSFLYNALVSEGGYGEAISETEEDNELAALSLEKEVSAVFSEMELFNTGARHPIVRNRSVEGRSGIYKPSFVQQNGSLFIMETVDFTLPQKIRPKEHAGYAAYMYMDIKKSHVETVPISLIKVTEQDQVNEEVATGLRILETESEQVVNWLVEDEKKRFLERCREIAYSAQ